MNRVISWLQNTGLRQAIAVVLTALVFLVAPVVNSTSALQAQAGTSMSKVDSDPVDRGTLKRIQQQAEDLGDSSERPIGDTGLKNIKKLGENIPETLDLKARQTREIYSSDETSVKDLEDVQNRFDKTH